MSEGWAVLISPRLQGLLLYIQAHSMITDCCQCLICLVASSSPVISRSMEAWNGQNQNCIRKVAQ